MGFIVLDHKNQRSPCSWKLRFFFLPLPLSQTATKRPSDETHFQKHDHHGPINQLTERPVHFRAFKASFNSILVRLEGWDLIQHNLEIDCLNIHQIITVCVICTMAVKVIMVFECNFIYEFGNLLRNFLITIEFSIEPPKAHNTTTQLMYDFMGPKPQTFPPSKHQMIV